jgi:hypothetical protein
MEDFLALLESAPFERSASSIQFGFDLFATIGDCGIEDGRLQVKVLTGKSLTVILDGSVGQLIVLVVHGGESSAATIANSVQDGRSLRNVTIHELGLQTWTSSELDN